MSVTVPVWRQMQCKKTGIWGMFDQLSQSVLLNRRFQMTSCVYLFACTFGSKVSSGRVNLQILKKEGKPRSVSKRWANRSILGLRLNSKSACLTGREWCKVLWLDLEHGHLWFYYLTYSTVCRSENVFFFFFVFFHLFPFLLLLILFFLLFISFFLFLFLLSFFLNVLKTLWWQF